jgi:hypothetical protein
MKNWSPGQPGVYSIFAIGRDNSGNYVGTNVFDITATTGSTGANIEVVKPFEVLNLDISNAEVTYSNSGGEITMIKPISAIGYGYFSIPRVDISGAGTGAKYDAVVDWNFSSPTYGSVIGFNRISSGTGYDSLTTNIRIIPTLQSVKIGEPTRIETLYDYNASGDIISSNYFTFTRYDGVRAVGSGYVTAPRINVLRSGRLRLQPPLPGESSTSVEAYDFSFGAPPLYPPAEVTGGFNHSPLFLEFNVSEAAGKVDSVHLAINGLIVQTVTSPPYAFDILLDDAGEYSLNAYVRDEFGNIKVSENIIVEVKDLIQSFPVAKFVEPDAGSMQVGSNFLLTALCIF